MIRNLKNEKADPDPSTVYSKMTRIRNPDKEIFDRHKDMIYYNRIVLANGMARISALCRSDQGP